MHFDQSTGSQVSIGEGSIHSGLKMRRRSPLASLSWRGCRDTSGKRNDGSNEDRGFIGMKNDGPRRRASPVASIRHGSAVLAVGRYHVPVGGGRDLGNQMCP